MQRLPSRELRALSLLARVLASVRRPNEFPGRALAALRHIVPAAIASYNEIEGRRRIVRAHIEPSDAAPTPDRLSIFAQHLHEHPILAHVQRTADNRALTMSNFVSRRQFHRLGLYEDYYRRLGTEYQMSTTLSATRSAVVAFALSRDARDFSGRERLLLSLARPHLVQAFRAARTLGALQHHVDLLSEAVERGELGIVALDADGRVLHMTSAARRRLEPFFGSRACAGRDLPPPLAAWLARQTRALSRVDDAATPPEPLALHGPDGRLTVRLVPGESGSDRAFLYVEAQPGPLEASGVPGLTPRESQVLEWVARGKSNADVGVILGISQKTVDKHLQHIFGKLGVETRTAAAAALFERASTPR